MATITAKQTAISCYEIGLRLVVFVKVDDEPRGCYQ